MEDFGLPRHVGQNGRRKEVIAQLMGLAAQQYRGAVLHRVGDMLADFFHGGRINQRADGDTIIHAITDFQLGHCHLQLFGKGVVNAVLYQEAVGANAGLAGVAIFGRDGTGDGGVQIGIVKHDKRRIAAQFHTGFFDGRGTLRQQLRTHFGAAGKGEFAYVRVGGQFATDSLAWAGDHIAHAGR
ncbi:hypothetical protein D3C72_1253380 [compost metagenome]